MCGSFSLGTQMLFEKFSEPNDIFRVLEPELWSVKAQESGGCQRSRTAKKTSLDDFWNRLRGEEPVQGEGAGHLRTKLLSAGPFSREGPAKAGCGPWLSLRLNPLRSFQSRRLPEHTDFLRGRTSERGRRWERLAHRTGSLRRN